MMLGVFPMGISRASENRCKSFSCIFYRREEPKRQKRFFPRGFGNYGNYSIKSAMKPLQTLTKGSSRDLRELLVNTP